MLKKIIIAVFVLVFAFSAFVVISAYSFLNRLTALQALPPVRGESQGSSTAKSPSYNAGPDTTGSSEDKSFTGNAESNAPDIFDNPIPPGLVPGNLPLDKIDIEAGKNAYGKASSLATRKPEMEDIKKLIPVLLKFTPSELSTLSRLADRKMSQEEITRAKSILLSKLSQEDINLLLQLGPKYGLDFRAVLGV